MGPRSDLPVDGDRLWGDLMAMGAITEPGRPYTRRAFSPTFDVGRAHLSTLFEQAGLAVHTDAAGNLIGRLEGEERGAAAVAVGSHSDTVPGGGRFDGVAGVIAGVEIARALRARGEPLRRPFEVIDFLAEEPTDFGVSCIGSRGLSGALSPAMLEMTEPSGERLDQAIRRVGGQPERLAGPLPHLLHAFLELHIEQGPVLEAGAIDIGVVTSIVGIRRLEIVFEGQAAHAGTAPMHLRRDAAVAAAETLVEIRRAAEALADEPGGYFVATVGIMQVEPGGSNVVPRRARLVVDARASDLVKTDAFAARIDRFSLDAAERARVRRTAFAVLSNGVPMACDPALQAALHGAARTLGLKAADIASGAGHDAAFMARLCPSAMVFIPCLRGMSHTPDEWAERDAVAAGAAVLFEAVLALDRAEAADAEAAA